MDWSAVAAIVGIAVGLGGVGSTIAFQSMVRGQRDSVEFLTLANSGLRDALKDSETKRENDKVACAQEVAALRGKVETLEGGLIERVAERVGERVGDKLLAALKEGR